MWPPSWLWALAYRLGHIRSGCESGRLVDANDPLHVFFAAVELVRINADFLQLPPVKHPSVIMQPAWASVVDGSSQGQRLFRRSLTWVMTLNGAERFTHPDTLEPCPFQRELLRVMRTPAPPGVSCRGRLSSYAGSLQHP